MQNHSSFKELKAEARKSLEGNYGRAISVLITLEIINLLPTYITLTLFSGSCIFNTICSELINFILTVFLQLLQIGICFFYMKIHCKQPAGSADLFYGFHTNRNTGLTIGLVFTAISYLCNLPATIISYTSGNPLLVIYLLLGGIIINFLIVIPIRQSYYLLLDFPEFTAGKVILFSIKLMKGNYIRYILFSLSFLPLVFISFLCCGIGLLWVVPYINAAMTAFYFDIIKNTLSTQQGIDIQV